MEIIIHGTKGGARVFYESPFSPNTIFDDLRGGGSSNALGETLYSIKIIPSGFAFTQYLIVKDIMRASIGYVAFSLFFNPFEELTSRSILNILDEISSEYKRQYLNNSELHEINENWEFIDSIYRKHKVVKSENNELPNFKTGKKEPGYIYYSDKGELESYLNNPLQDEYRDYKLIFFISKNLEEKPNNPLRTLSHSDSGNLTGKIDLANETFYLIPFEETSKDGVKTELKINGNIISQNGTLLVKNSKIELKFSKKNYKSKIIEGSITEGELKNYFVIIGQHKVSLKTEVKLEEDEKTVIFEYNRNNIEIICQSVKYNNKNSSYNKVQFRGDEISARWNVAFKQDGYSLEDSIDFIPEDISSPIKISIKEKSKQNRDKIYIAKAGLNGEFYDNNTDHTTTQKDGSDIKYKIRANRGWEFIGFKNDDKRNGQYSGTLTAEYRKIKPIWVNPKFIAACLLLIITAVIILFNWDPNTSEVKTAIVDSNQIKKDTSNKPKTNTSISSKDSVKSEDKKTQIGSRKPEEDKVKYTETPKAGGNTIKKDSIKPIKKSGSEEKFDGDDKFWELISTNCKDFEKYKKLNNNLTLKKSEKVKTFLHDITIDNKDVWKRFTQIPDGKRKNATNIESLNNLYTNQKLKNEIN